MRYAYEYYKKSSDYIREKIGGDVEIGLILGSAMGAIGDQIEDKIILEYKQIPNFLLATVVDHAGLLIAGRLGGKRVICMSGRFHYYEGYDFEKLAVPVRVLKLLGVEKHQEKDTIMVVIVKKGDKQVGFVIDALIGQQEIVIKSLGKYLSGIKMIAGATILGNGEVALILDINTLI